MTQEFTESPGSCPDCGIALQWVRPGKVQTQCDCWTFCPVHGRGAIQYHGEGVVPGLSGYFCLHCEQP
jgi:hypothetical protein